MKLMVVDSSGHGSVDVKTGFAADGCWALKGTRAGSVYQRDVYYFAACLAGSFR